MIKNIIYFFIIKFNILIVFENRKRIINLKYHKKEVQLHKEGYLLLKKGWGKGEVGWGGCFQCFSCCNYIKGKGKNTCKTLKYDIA